MRSKVCTTKHKGAFSIFVVSLNKNFLLLTRQKVQTPAAVTAKFLSILLCRENSIQLLQSQKHGQFQLSVSQSAVSNKTFYLWIKLKGFDESLRMNMFTLHAARGIISLICSTHPAVTTGRAVNEFPFPCMSSTNTDSNPFPERTIAHLVLILHKFCYVCCGHCSAAIVYNCSDAFPSLGITDIHNIR